MQQYYYITVAGSRRKTDKYGKPYGWPANVYDKVENWAPQEWMKLNSGLSRDEARELVLTKVIDVGRDLKPADVKKIFSL